MTQPPSKRKRRPWKRFVLAAGLSVVVLLLLLWKTGTKLATVGREVTQVDLFVLGITFLLSAAVHILLGSYKWFLILRAMDCPTSFGEVLFVRMGSDPVRIVAPFKTGELSNIAYFWRRGKLTFARSASWVLFDKALNIGGTFFWFAVGVIAYLAAFGRAGVLEVIADPKQRVALITGALLAGVAVAIAVALMSLPWLRRLLATAAGKVHGKLGNIVRQLLSTFDEIPWRRKGLLLVYGVLFQLRPLIVCYLLMVAYRGSFRALPGVPVMLAWGSIVVACANVPYLLWGVGAREVALTALFPTYLAAGADTSVLIAIGIWMAIAIHIVPALFGLPILGSFLGSLETGHVPSAVNGDDEEEAAP